MLTPLLSSEWIRRRCCTPLSKAELALLEEQIKRVLLFLLPFLSPFVLQTLPSFGSRGFVIRAEPGKPLPKRGENEENIVIHIKHPFLSFGAVVLSCGWKMVGRSRHYFPTGPPSFSRMFFFPHLRVANPYIRPLSVSWFFPLLSISSETKSTGFQSVGSLTGSGNARRRLYIAIVCIVTYIFYM